MNEKVKEFLNNKRISILGDSISTLQGISNNPSYLNMLISNATYYDNQIELEETYFMQVVNHFNFQLCVNNSWSGSFVSKTPAMSGNDMTGYMSSGITRAKYLKDAFNNSPDIILIFMGVNDLGIKEELSRFSSSYLEMMENISLNYQNAFTFFVGLPSLTELANKYNEFIKNATLKNKKWSYIDLANSDYNKNRINLTFDSLHPNKLGMKYIANAIIYAIENYFMRINI